MFSVLRGSWPPAITRSAEEVLRIWSEREANDSMARAMFFFRSNRLIDNMILRDLKLESISRRGT